MTTASSSGAQACAGDPDAYGPAAEAFARLSRRFTAPLAEALLDHARLQAGERVLDVGTGSGVVARAAAARVGVRGSVVGVDVSEALLDCARAETAGLPQVEYRRHDAQQLLLDDASFDVVVSLYALAHVENAGAAVRQMLRVLRPGGRVVLAVGAGPPFLESWRGRSWTTQVLAWRGKALIAPGLVAEALRRSGVRLAHPPRLRPGDLRTLLRAAGLRDVEETWIGQETPVERAQELWDLEATFSTPVRGWCGAASPHEVEGRRRVLVEHANRVLAAGGRLVHRQGARVFLARRP